MMMRTIRSEEVEGSPSQTPNKIKMESNSFFKKFLNPFLWLNILAMAIIVILLSMGLRYGLDLYTHHGQTVEVPSILHKTYNDAEDLLDKVHLDIVVSDTDYVKTMPPDCVLEQSPVPGEIVKPGRLIYVKINASSTPRRPLPDIIDNSSLRDAQSRLTALGFQLGEPEYIPGEKEWVYGIKDQGRQLAAGDRVSIEDPLVIQVGDGRRDMSQPVTYIDSNTYYFGEEEEEEEEKPQKVRPHYRRITERRGEEHQAESSEPSRSERTTSSFTKVDIPTVTTAPTVPSAPKPVKTE